MDVIQEGERVNTYDEFEGDFLKIAETIQQRRFQLLVHSCIYYELNQNIISDKKWDEWARELRDLQNKYPDISSRVILYEDFKDWDASTGAFLPIKQDWVVRRAQWLLSKGQLHSNSKSIEIKCEFKKEQKMKKKSLF